jgi:ElaB protein
VPTRLAVALFSSNGKRSAAMGIFSKAGHTVDSTLNGARRQGEHAVSRASDVAHSTSSQWRSLLDDLDDTLKRGSDLDIDNLRSQLQAKLNAARSAVEDTKSTVTRQFNDAWGSADEYVHGNPWQTIALVAGAALLIGLLAGRR